MPNFYAESYKNLFVDFVQPARYKWSLSERIQSYKVKVAVRFKPGSQKSSKLVLPLHQVLQFKKKGQKLSKDFRKDYGVNSDQLYSHLQKGGDVAPEIMQALIEAEQLQMLLESSKPKRVRRTVWNEETEKLEDVEFEVIEEQDNHQAAIAGDLTALADHRVDIAQLRERTVQKMENDQNILNNQNQDKEDHDADRYYCTAAKLLAIMKSKVAMYVPGAGIKQFHFSSIFNCADEQGSVYNAYGKQPVIDVLNGINSSILCYGQTGSGKTHTMFGNQQIVSQIITDYTLYGCLTQRTKDGCGVVLRAMDEILGFKASANTNVAVNIKYLQIYNEKITDLSSGEPVHIRENKLRGSTEVSIHDLTDFLSVLAIGERRKKYAETKMNEHSSRGHTIIIVNVTQTHPRDAGQLLCSTLYMADLAGSEQIKKSEVTGINQREAMFINVSLLSLGNCIKALVANHSHIPYYDSKLTQLLRGSFGGNSKTYVIINASQDDSNGDQTMQALRFGESCSLITNATKSASSSFAAAIKVIDETLNTVLKGMENLENKKMTHLQSYKNLRDRYNQLVLKRKELLRLNENKVEEATETNENDKMDIFKDEGEEEDELDEIHELQKNGGFKWVIDF